MAERPLRPTARYGLLMRAITCVCLVVCVTIARPCLADEKSAREHFEKGVELFRRSEAATALGEFEAADREHHAPAITYNIARALEALGRVHGAIAAYEKYIVEAGESGEFTSSATVAIAELKSKSTRLRVETKPAGASVRVDGVLIDEKSPVVVYVLAGRHNIAVEIDDWNDQKDVNVSGGGTSAETTLTRPAPKKAGAPLPVPQVIERRIPPPPPIEPSGLMGGLALSFSGYTFVNKDSQAEGKPSGLVFGLAVDVGYAVSQRTSLMIRALGGFGSKEGSLATVGAGGPIVSWRATSDLWLGGGLVIGGGRADSSAQTEGEVTSSTDFAIGPSGEITYAFANDSTGQWVVSLLPGMLITTNDEQSTVFVPLVLGHRWF